LQLNVPYILYALQAALSKILMVTIKLFLIGPLKSFISQLSGPRKLAFHKGCEMNDFNGSSFLRIENAKSGLKTP